jgi:sarcosine oxidase subunit beta
MGRDVIRNPDFLIIGGGIFGCAIAWNLAKRSAGSVLLLERRELATATTSMAAALVTRVRSEPGQTAIMGRTRESIEVLGAELGEPLDLHQVGGLQVAASDASVVKLQALEQLAIENKEAFLWIDRAEAEERVPWLDGSSAQKFALLPDDAFIDPYMLAMAYAKAARQHGAVIKTGCEVTQLAMTGQRVTGVMTNEGIINAGCVIDAAGPWAGLISQEAGWHLPMAPVRSHYWITATAAEFSKPQPFVILPDANAYARTEVGGLLFGLRDRASLTRDPRSLPTDLAQLHYEEDPQGWDVLEDRGPALATFFPGLENAEIAHYVAGPSTYTPDGQFVLGAIPDVDGFLVATGCCGAGIAASGGIGAAISDLAIDGRTSFDLKGCRTDRFGQIDAFSPEWLRRCALARSQKKSG